MLDQLLEKLITFKTIPENHAENIRAFSWVKKQLEGLPLYLTEYESSGFPSLLITTQHTKTPDIWLMAHMDVVSGTKDMFKPRYENKSLFGRGTFDMKFAIACYIQLLSEIPLSKYNIGVMLTSDEEIGGANGVGRLVKEGYLSQVALLPDGGENWSLQGSAKGVYQLKIISKGVSAHGARPWLGSNAIVKLMTFLTILQSKFQVEPCGDKEHYHTTLNIGEIHGGQSTNQVPLEATANIDIRFIPEDSFQSIKKIIDSNLKGFPDIKVKEISRGSSYKVPKSNTNLSKLLTIMEKTLNTKPIFINSHGSSDARYFVEKNIPVILLRPIGGGLHSESEWIDIDSFHQFYKILKEFIYQFEND